MGLYPLAPGGVFNETAANGIVAMILTCEQSFAPD